MTARPVEWILVIFYGPSAHRATYGRLGGTHYTKDYIQLSRKSEFIDALTNLFPAPDGAVSFPLTYEWPTGSTPGEIVFRSADRPHLKWETSLGAPRAWRMSPVPTKASAETIPGDPTHLSFSGAEGELTLLKSRGAGQPYRMAIKLRDEPQKLHLRAYLANPNEHFTWADAQLTPPDIQALLTKTSQQSALAWSMVQSGGTAPTAKVKDAVAHLAASEDLALMINTFDVDTALALTSYLEKPAYGLFFDPTQNHDAWSQPLLLPEKIASSVDDLLEVLKARFPLPPQGDAVAETLEFSPEQLEVFLEQIKHNNFEVNDTYSTTKTRGSAQRAFSDSVKKNYNFCCAITGIVTRDFLVAAHIVPWSQDKSIRLDPSNGICLSLLMDRAYEHGYIIIEDDLIVVVDWAKVGADSELRSHLKAYDGQKLRAPLLYAPRPEYLKRRRELVISTA